jgi:hypothetical protein
VTPNAAHQRHGKVARILRFAKCVTLCRVRCMHLLCDYLRLRQNPGLRRR